MKHTKWILPISVALICILIFVGGIFLSEGIKDDRSKVNEALQVAMKEVFVEADQFTYLSDGSVTQGPENQVIQVYQAKKDKMVIGYVYYVKTQGYARDFYHVIGIKGTTASYGVITGYRWVTYQETYLDKITESFKRQFVNQDITSPKYGDDLETVSGATKSSNAIILATQLARQQYFKDLNVEVPANKVTCKSLKQSMTNVSELIGELKLGNKSFTVIFEYANSVLSYKSSTEQLSSADIQNCLAAAKQKMPETIILSVTASGTEKTVIVQGTGYNGKLVGEVKIDVTNHKITSFTITQHQESFNDPVTKLPTDLVNAGDAFENVSVISGATVSSNAIKAMFRLVVEYSKGGNQA